MKHLLTLDTQGDVRNANGDTVARLHDTSHILDFLAGVQAGVEIFGGRIGHAIIREGDIPAWEAATVARESVHAHYERHAESHTGD